MIVDQPMITHVAQIRQICAREFELPIDHAFFIMDREPGETIDQTLVRGFCEERMAQIDNGYYRSDLEVVLTLVYG